ncbi:DELTA-sagatoxin-Srs1a-like [Scomber scombrus]|uniref:DELTA-sagatoxin-Srs1a-like n=1 Tax=Scomber scombrus TaxID=13677 RepID=UPI002DD81A0B|nr:DELTA-sagatoxin-Srs1a-like [Scomber scombrus]
MADFIDAAATVGGAIAEMAPTHRQCSIEIRNECKGFSLCNPRMHIVSGTCAIPLLPLIGSTKSGKAQFVKTPHTACGSVGVFTYDLQKTDADQSTEKIAVMFSVPYDFNMYSNWYAVGIFDKSKECNHDLYYEMYNNTHQSFARGKAKDSCLTHKGDHVTVMATMSDSYQPIIKLQVKER